MRDEDKQKLKYLLGMYSNKFAVKEVDGVNLDDIILSLEKVQEYFFELEHSIKINDRLGLEDIFQKSRKLKLKSISMALLQIITSLKNVNDYTSLYKSLTYIRNNDTEQYKKSKTEIVEYLIDSANLTEMLKTALLEGYDE